MNVCALQDEIIRKPEHIATILDKLGHEDIKDRGKYFQAKNIDGDNPTGCSVRKDDLVWSNFSHGKNGSIWTLIQDETGCGFKQALELAAKWIGYSGTMITRIPFPEILNQCVKASKQGIIDLPTYEDSKLPTSTILSEKFAKDGVNPVVQKLWGVRYDPECDGVIIPWRDACGDLIGAKWRNNDPNCSDDKRWGMYIRFQVAQAVYGWFENRESIIRAKRCYIFEAEKSVLQAYTMGIKTGLAIGNHNISRAQALYIGNLFPREIIVAFDGGLCEDEILFNAKKLVEINKVTKPRIGYIYDESGQLLKGKDSPTDNGLENFNEILEGCIKWVN